MTDAAEQKPRVGFCRQTARKVLKNHGLGGPPTGFDEILRKEGLEVVELDWPQKTSGILLRANGVIGVNANHAPVRRRFSVAHELGHHFLQHHLWFEKNHQVTLDSPPAEGCEGALKTPEREADIFAAELLMPLAILKKHATKGRTPQELARLFEVSEQTMFYALQDHGLLGRL